MSQLTDAIREVGPAAAAAAIASDPAWRVFNLLWATPEEIIPACDKMGWQTLEQLLAWVQTTASAIGDSVAFEALIDPPAPVTTAGMKTTPWPPLHVAIHATGLLSADCLLHNSDGTYFLPTKVQWDQIAAACPSAKRKHSGTENMDCFGSTHPVQSKMDGVVAWKTIEQVHRAHQAGRAVQVLDKSGEWQYVINSLRKASSKRVIALGVRQGVAVCTEDHQVMGPSGWVDASGHDISPGKLNLLSYGNFDQITAELAWSYGLFCADGHARKKSTGTKYINIINTVREYIDRAGAAFNDAFDNTFTTPVWASDQAGNTRGSATLRSTQHRLQFNPSLGRIGRPSATDEGMRNNRIFEQFAAFYDEDKNKIVPRFMFGQSKEVIAAFLDGYYAGNGDKRGSKPNRITVPSALLASQMAELYARVGEVAHLIPYKNKRAFDLRIGGADIIYRMTSATHEADFVYDITTTTGSFASGSLLTHNCDDFVNIARGWLSSKGLGNCAAASVATRHFLNGSPTGGHAVVLVWDANLTPWQWEPQTGILHPAAYPKLGGNFLAQRVEYARVFA